MNNNNKNNNSHPEKYYPNSDKYKTQILSENKTKSGIYMWKNLVNDKQYIGSSDNLKRRFS
jgi:excinuclease UvrABC nuclease subunit